MGDALKADENMILSTRETHVGISKALHSWGPTLTGRHLFCKTKLYQKLCNLENRNIKSSRKSRDERDMGWGLGVGRVRSYRGLIDTCNLKTHFIAEPGGIFAYSFS